MRTRPGFFRSINEAVPLGGTPLAASSDTDEILFHTYSNSGSTNTSVTVFGTVPASTDTYTVTSTAAAGSSAAIVRSGLYLVTAGFGLSETTGAQSSQCAITLASTDLIGAFTATASFVRAYQTIDGDAAGDNPSTFLSALVIVSRAAAAAATAIVRHQFFAVTDADTGAGVHSLRITRFGNFDG